MRLVITLNVLALLIPCQSSAKSMNQNAMIRMEAQHVCFDDAMRLCREFVPDEDRIADCMRSKRAQLSEACGRVFDEAGE